MDDCFAGAPQEFLVCITVHKAAKVGVNSGDLYVKVSLDKMTKNTKTFANSENPFFNEYFVFEFHCTLTELLRLTILFELKKSMLYKKNVIVGELLIDLHSVWNQPNHSYMKKWGRLESPIAENTHKDDSNQSHGHLQIDLAIISQHSPFLAASKSDQQEAENLNKWLLDQDFDDIESNLLQNSNTYTPSNIRYFIGFYRGYFIKKSNYMIQVSFAGFNGKTQVAKHTTTPIWNHEITFAWIYPSLAQRFLILIFAYEHLQWKCVTEYELSFEEIAFNDKPSLGPTYLHLYDPVNPLNYVGRLLMELRSESMVEMKPSHVLITHSVAGLDESRYWRDDIYLIEFLPLMGDHIHTSASHYKFSVRLAEHTSNTLEGNLKTPSGKFHSSIHTKYFHQEGAPYHSCLFRVRLPDNRSKYESDYFMIELVNHMRSELETFQVFQLKFSHHHESQAKCLKSIITNILNKIKEGISAHRFDYEVDTQRTTWDINRQLYLLDYFSKLPQELRVLRQKLRCCFIEHLDASVADVLNELQRLAGEINSLSNMLRVQDEWPELILSLSAGGKELGVCRLNAKHFLNAEKRQKNPTSHNHCWKVKSFVFKSVTCNHSCTNCGCNAALILGCVSIVIERERKEFLSRIASDWSSPEPMVWQPKVIQTHFRCHVYVHQAKVRPAGDRTSITDGHLRVLFGEHVAETYTSSGAHSPIWNAVITLKGVTLPGTVSWYMQNPPMFSLEFRNSDRSTSDDNVAKGYITASVLSGDLLKHSSWDDAGICWTRSPIQKLQKLKHVTPPPLKWISVARNGIVLAEVLMSAELIELVGDAKDHENDKELVLATGIPTAIRPNMLNFVLEVIFVGLRNYTKSSMSSAGKRRIKVMMGDLVLTSGLSTARIRNTINFLVAYASGVVSLPDQQEYWPAMIATDVLLSGFGHESTLGAALISNLSNFLQKNKTKMCVKKDNDHDDDDDDGGGGDNNNDDGRESVASTTLSVDPIEETDDDDYDEENVEPPHTKVKNCWMRLLFALGLRPAAYANRRALRFENDIDDSDLSGDSQFSWWTKFYNSLYMDSSEKSHQYKHRLIIYPNELEKQAEFGYLQDWAIPVQLVHGVKMKKQGPPKEDIYATLKIHIKLTPCQCEATDDGGGGDMLRPLAASLNPRYQTMIKSLSDAVRLTVRVYIVQGIQIRPRDKNQNSDCFVRLMVGAKTVSDSAHYIANQSNPIFGRFFELDATLPGDHMLQIILYDHDKLKDDIIGQTNIDLEDRWRSKHRATVGIAHEYSRQGYNLWHDIRLPSEILMELCQQRGIQPPYYYGKVIEVDGMLFGDETIISKNEELQERLSLTVLKNLDKLPSFGYNLVPEHVETRSLYRNEYPNLEQGKLQLWIELYEANMYTPQPIDIAPIPPAGYEIRVVVKNLSGIQAGDRNVFGKLMSDIYVIGWCQDAQRQQSTDIHYRSFAGDAAFNWRMLFPIKYSANEDMMVIRRKSGLHEEFEIKRPPIIYFQVWDKDLMSSDDYLASIELNLSNMPIPYPTDRQCRPYPKKRKRINLFKQKAIKGWFPLQSRPIPKSGIPVTTMSGKIELEIEICTEVEASNSPAGLGHDPPMALERPYRPDTAFNPLTHPLKSFSRILWPVIRKYVLWTALIVIIFMGLILFVSNLPGKLMSLPFK